MELEGVRDDQSDDSHGRIYSLTISAGNSPAFRPGMKGEKFICNF
jgi:hypothetical protein